jgi:hypothetical protein
MSKESPTSFLTPEQVASQIAYSVSFVKAHSRFHAPKLPVLRAVKLARKYRYLQEDVNLFVAALSTAKG